MKIAIIGAGQVGGALGRVWSAKGHTVIYGVRGESGGKTTPPMGPAISSAPIREAVKEGEIVVLATPWQAVSDVLAAMGDLRGKIIVDCTNPLALNAEGSLSLAVGFTTSGAEEIERQAPGAHVAKAFNTYGWENFADAAYPNAAGLKPVMFFCTDHEPAKEIVAQLAADLGFEPVDTGGLGMARSLEPLALLWIRMAIREGRNPNFTWARLRR